MRKQSRREKREERRKEEEYQKLKNEIKVHFLEKGESRDHILQYEIVDVNGNFEKGKHFFGSVGGSIMQICLALVSIKSHCSKDENKKVFDGKKDKNPIELL